MAGGVVGDLWRESWGKKKSDGGKCETEERGEVMWCREMEENETREMGEGLEGSLEGRKEGGWVAARDDEDDGTTGSSGAQTGQRKKIARPDLMEVCLR